MIIIQKSYGFRCTGVLLQEINDNNVAKEKGLSDELRPINQ